MVVTRHGEGIAKLVPVRDLEEKLAASGVRAAERSGPIPKVRPIGRQGHEVQLLQANFSLGRQNHTGAGGKPGERGGCRRQCTGAA